MYRDGPSLKTESIVIKISGSAQAKIPSPSGYSILGSSMATAEADPVLEQLG